MPKWWEGRPWRQIQTNLRQIDMRDIDAERFVADLQSFRATSVLLNTAGIIASYPTKLPFQTQSACLQGASLAEIIAACHRAGIRVLARTDFSKVRRPIYEAHPDWAYRTADGRIVDYNGDVHVCVAGDYQQIYALQIIEEALTTLDVDGIFFNMGGFQTRDYSGVYYGPCHCAACQRAFGEMYGLPLPRVEDLADPAYRKYRVFQRQVVNDLNARVQALIHRLRPEICIDRDTSGNGYIRQESNTALDRPLPHWQYSASANTKWAVSSYPSMISSNTTVDFIDFPTRHVAVSPHQQALRLVQSLANGGALDYYLIGRLDNHADRSGFAPIRRLFAYHAAHGEEYVGLRPRAEIALLDDSRGNSAECRGWYRALSEHHHLFDLPQVDAALDLPWERYRAVILPDLRYLSDALAARLDRFVAEGGVLIASGQAGFYDQDYEPRPAPALQCLGIGRVEQVRHDMRGSYLLFGDKTSFPRFADTDLVYLDGDYIYYQPIEPATPQMRLMPPQPFGPPERCYGETVLARPGYMVRPYGQGRAIYIPWMPGALFHRQGHLNTADWLADVLEGVAGLRPVAGNLPPQVEVTLGEQASGRGWLLHLVNASGHFGNSFYAPLPLCNLWVEIACPSAPQAVYSLVQEAEVPWRYQDGRLRLEIAHLELFEALRIGW